MHTCFRLFVLGCVIASLGCGGRARSSRIGADGGATTDGSMSTDASPTFSENCPTSPVFDQQTCTGSTNGSVCAGHGYCDACARDVATTCTCVPGTLGYQFECDDPCDSCAVDAGVLLEDSGAPTGDAGVADAGAPFTAYGACQFATGDGHVICQQYSAEWTRSDAEFDCANTSGATYLSVCPLANSIGACVLPGGYFWFYSPTTLEQAMPSCVDGGGTWVEP